MTYSFHILFDVYLLVYYPSDLEKENKKYPLIVLANGSGIPGSKSKALFRHYASWGFIVVGNEDKSSWSGETMEVNLRKDNFLVEDDYWKEHSNNYEKFINDK